MAEVMEMASVKPGVAGEDFRVYEASQLLKEASILCPHQHYSNERESERESRENLDLRVHNKESEQSMIRRYSGLLLCIKNIGRTIDLDNGRATELYQNTLEGYLDRIEEAYKKLEVARIAKDIKCEYLALLGKSSELILEAYEDSRSLPLQWKKPNAA